MSWIAINEDLAALVSSHTASTGQHHREERWLYPCQSHGCCCEQFTTNVQHDLILIDIISQALGKQFSLQLLESGFSVSDL